MTYLIWPPKKNKGPRARWIYTFLPLLFFVSPFTAFAQVDPQTCTGNINQAETQLANGFFQDAIALLEPCTDLFSLDQTERARAFKLLADAHLATRNLPEARIAIGRLLDLTPNYTPDVNLDSQTFRDLVNEIRSERTPPAAPEGLTAMEENGQIRLAWTAAADSAVDRIRILRGLSPDSLAPLDSTTADTTMYADDQVETGVEYYYALQAIGTNGFASGQSDIRQAFITPPIVEDAPGNPPIKASPPSWRKWVFIGGGLVAGGVVAAATLSGGGGGGGEEPPRPLPGPPSVP